MTKHSEHQNNILRPYRVGDLPVIWGDLRPDDVRELSGAGFTDPMEIERGLIGSPSVITWDTESGPVAVVGVSPTGIEGWGLVWAIASNRAMPRWRFAVRNTEKLLSRLGQGYLVLGNYKDTRNTTQIKWLQKLGFTFINEHDGGDGRSYYEFLRIIQ